MKQILRILGNAWFEQIESIRNLIYDILVIKTSNPEDVLLAIEIASDGYIVRQTEKFSCFLGGDLKKIQYLYDVEAKKWEVNYMVTSTGQVIGSEKNYRKAVKLYNTIMKTPGAGFSVGGTASNE